MPRAPAQMRCEHCFGLGWLTAADVVLIQLDAEIAHLPRIGLCSRHWRGLEKTYHDLGWRLVKTRSH